MDDGPLGSEVDFEPFDDHIDVPDIGFDHLLALGGATRDLKRELTSPGQDAEDLAFWFGMSHTMNIIHQIGTFPEFRYSKNGAK